MTEFLVTWSEQIIIEIIIVVNFELIIPNSKNKKYIKIVFGIFIMYIIISPLISSKIEDFSNSISIETFNENGISSDSKKVDIVNGVTEKVYTGNLKSNIEEHLKLQGYLASVNSININKDTNYIEEISITIKEKIDNKTKEDKNKSNEVERINEVKIEDIELGKNNEKKTNKENKSKNEVSSDENDYIKKYLSDMYDIDDKNINIIWE